MSQKSILWLGPDFNNHAYSSLEMKNPEEMAAKYIPIVRFRSPIIDGNHTAADYINCQLLPDLAFRTLQAMSFLVLILPACRS